MATEAAGTRFRTDLDGSRGFTFSGLPLRPSLEVWLRHDGGDAETGSGIDIGGGLVVSNPLLGLSADVRARMLLVHQAEGFRDRGVSRAFSFDPAPETPLGFLAKVTPSWGGQAESGAEALWGWDTMTGLENGSIAAGGRLAADLSYGLPVGSRFVDTPRIGIGDLRNGTGLPVRLQPRLARPGGVGLRAGPGCPSPRAGEPQRHGSRPRRPLHGALVGPASGPRIIVVEQREHIPQSTPQ